MRNGRLLAASFAVLSVLIGGCVVAPASGHHYVETVRVAPPPPYVEYVGRPPVIGHIWIGGYWHWGGARYVWVPGRWEAPRHGHRWVPHRWERDGDRWRRHGGHWERDHHQAPSPFGEDRHRGERAYPRHDDRQHHQSGRRHGEVRPPQMIVSPFDPVPDRHRGGARRGEADTSRMAIPQRPAGSGVRDEEGDRRRGRGDRAGPERSLRHDAER